MSWTDLASGPRSTPVREPAVRTRWTRNVPLFDVWFERDMTSGLVTIIKLMTRKEFLTLYVCVCVFLQLHTWTHPKLSELSFPEIEKQLQRTYDFLTSCGAEPTQFRPPYGIMSRPQANYVSYNLGAFPQLHSVLHRSHVC